MDKILNNEEIEIARIDSLWWRGITKARKIDDFDPNLFNDGCAKDLAL